MKSIHQQKPDEMHQPEAASLPSSDELAKNPNPRANENVRVRTEDPHESNKSEHEVGSEITDGEDG
jgi:hypothetical protein